MSNITERLGKIPKAMTEREIKEASERLRRAFGIRESKPEDMEEGDWVALQAKIERALEEHVRKCRDAQWMMMNARYLVVANNPELVAAILRVEWFCDPFCMGVAYTNGTQIAVGAAFSEFRTRDGEPDQRVQSGILAHEMMHVAMGHPARMAEFMQKHPEIPHFLLNITADVIINEGLIKNGFQLPKDTVRWASYLKLAPEGDPIHEKAHAGGEVFEAMALRAAEWMKDRIEASDEKGQRGNGGRPRRAGPSDEPPDGRAITMRVRAPGKDNEMRDRIEDEVRRLLAPHELDDDMRVRTVRKLEGERAANEIRRMFREGAQMGSGENTGHGRGLGNTLRELQQIDAGPVNWRRELDQIARRTFEAKRRTRWGWPSRQTLSQIAQARPGCRVGLRSKRVRERKPGLLHIGSDTSGSIDDPKLEQFLAHGARIAAQHGAKILFSLSDEDIRAAEVIETSGKSLSWIHQQFVRLASETQGGGGTSFVCVTQLARERNADATFFYTDLMGTFDDTPPPGQMVWCVHKDEAIHEEYEPPYGRVLRISV